MTAALPTVRITVAGDLALGGEYLQRARPGNLPLTYPFSTLQGSLASTELLIVNLEGPLGTGGVPRAGRSALLHNDPEVLNWLGSFPTCVCVLANNHMMDYGAEALRRTLELLQARGIHVVGAGLTQSEADRALMLTLHGLKVGIFAFTTDEVHVGSVLAGPDSAGSTGLPKESEACMRVSTLAKDTDAVIVALHSGYEHFNFPTPSQVALARKLVNSGATLVVGHHPHVQQGCETIGNSFICHSLGNLLLPEMRAETGRVQYRKPSTKQFALLHAQLEPQRVNNPNLEGGRCNSRYNLQPYSGPAQKKFEKEMAALSQPLSSHDYDLFWQRYHARRLKQLKREALRDAVTKIVSSDWRTLVRTVSFNDFKRNFQRVFGSL